MNKNDFVTLCITSVTSEGHGVSKKDGYVFFVPHALLGETVQAKVLKIKKTIVFCKVEEVIIPSSHRITPPCPYFKKCGSCYFLDSDYESQLEVKLIKVNDAIKRIGKLDIDIKKIIPSPEIFNYRNKALIPVSSDESSKAICGFYRQRSHQVIDMEDCFIQDKDAFKIAGAVIEWMNEFSVPPYDELKGTGLVRHIYFKKGIHTKDIMAGIVSYKKDIPHLDELKQKLLDLKIVTSGIVNINKEKTNVILGDETICLFGNPYITDKILDKSFKIGSKSFFQVNPYNVGNLYKQAIDFLELNENDILFDIYCGIGTIGICAADNIKELIGVEVIPEAITYARENAKLNGINNATFYVGKAEDIIYDMIKNENKPTKVILDPPRAGCEESLLKEIIKLNPEKIAYVSCDVATLARDLNYIKNNSSYEIKEVIACDMFPNTPHVEAVALLQQLSLPDGK